MENEHPVIAAFILYNGKSILTRLGCMFGGMFITICVAIACQSEVVGTVGIIICMCLPMLCNQAIQNFFTKRVMISFNKDDFSIEIFNLKTDKLEKREIYQYDNVKNCRLTARQKDIYTIIQIRFYKGYSRQYVFIDDDETIDTNEVVYNQLRSSIIRQTGNNDINLEPGFDSTKIIAVIVAVLVVIVMILLLYRIAGTYRLR